MEKEAMEMVDLGILMLVIALCLITGVSITYKTNRRAYQYNQSYMQDKNTANKNSTYAMREYGTYDATLTRGELMLMTQIQDSNMPYPKKIRINNIEMSITYTYKEYIDLYGSYMKNEIISDNKNTTYRLTFENELYPDGSNKNAYFNIVKN